MIHGIPEGEYLSLPESLAHDFRVHFHDLPPEGEASGRTVLFLHGSGPGASGWSNFAANAETWRAAGHRCLLPDLPGYGLSSKPPEQVYSFALLAGSVLALLEHLGLERVVIVGNSMGGALAIKLALDHPERVEKLVLMAPGGLESSETYMAMRGIRSMLRCIFGPEGITRDGMARVFARQVHDPSLVTDALVDSRTAVALTQPRRIWETMKVPNQADRLGEIACPLLCFWGREDLFCPVSGAMTVLLGCPEVEVILLSRCGHWVMVEHRERFDAESLAFLAR